MKLFEFIKGQLSESDGVPSNNRVMLFLFLSTIMLLLLAVVFVPLVLPGASIKLPDVPASFESFVEYVTAFLVLGGAAGKGINAYKEVKGGASDQPDKP